jgi:hypothetical protein
MKTSESPKFLGGLILSKFLILGGLPACVAVLQPHYVERHEVEISQVDVARDGWRRMSGSSNRVGTVHRRSPLTARGAGRAFPKQMNAPGEVMDALDRDSVP